MRAYRQLMHVEPVSVWTVFSISAAYSRLGLLSFRHETSYLALNNVTTNHILETLSASLIPISQQNCFFPSTFPITMQFFYDDDDDDDDDVL